VGIVFTKASKHNLIFSTVRFLISKGMRSVKTLWEEGRKYCDEVLKYCERRDENIVKEVRKYCGGRVANVIEYCKCCGESFANAVRKKRAIHFLCYHTQIVDCAYLWRHTHTCCCCNPLSRGWGCFNHEPINEGECPLEAAKAAAWNACAWARTAA